MFYTKTEAPTLDNVRVCRITGCLRGLLHAGKLAYGPQASQDGPSNWFQTGKSDASLQPILHRLQLRTMPVSLNQTHTAFHLIKHHTYILY